MLSKNLQDDLKYEKELNDKLRDEVSRNESQKSQLFVQLREQQGLAEQFDKEIKSLEGSILNKELETRNVVELLERGKQQVSDLKLEIATLQDRLHSQDENIQQLTQEIQKVEDERNDLIARMNDLTNKYETYVSTMTREREDLAKTTKKHMKLLTAKILAEKLSLILKKQYFGSVNRMGSQLHEDSLKRHMTDRIGNILISFSLRTMKSAFQQWHYSELNWPKERKRREELLENIVLYRSKSLAFATWLRTNRAANHAEKENVFATRKMCQILEKIGKEAVAEAFLKIKYQWNEDKKRRLQLNRVCLQKKLKALRLGFETWKVGTKHIRQRLAFEFLAEKLAEGQVTQVAFHRLKDAVRQNRIDKQIAKYRGFRYWMSAKKKASLKNKAALITLKLEEYTKKEMIRRILHALKQNQVESQLTRVSNNLQETIHRHKELDNAVEATNSEHEVVNKALAIKRLACHLANRMYPFFSKWRRYCIYYKQGLNKLKLLTLRIYRNKLSGATSLWKQEAKHIALRVISESIQEAKEKITNLERDHIDKENQEKGNEDNRKEKSLKKLARNVEIIVAQYKRSAIRNWHKKAQNLKDVDNKLSKMCKSLKSIKLWDAIKKYYKQVKDINLENLLEERVAFLQKKAFDNRVRKNIATLKNWADRRKRAKAKIKSAINKFELCQCGWEFQQWRRTIRVIRIEDLKNKEQELTIDEENLRKQHENLTEENEKLNIHQIEKIKTVKERNLLVLWNIALRQKVLDRQSALKKWRLRVFKQKRLQKNTKRTLLRCFSLEIRLAFNKWLGIIRGKGVQEKIKNLEEEKIKLKIGKKKSQMDMSERETSREDAIKILERAKASEAKTRDICAKVQGYLITKRDKNTFLPLQQAIIQRWKAIADKEKHLSDSLMALSRRHIFEHVLVKIKNATLAKKEFEGKIRAFTIISEKAYKSLIKDSFDKWQNFSYGKSVQNFQSDYHSKTEQLAAVENSINTLNEKLYSNGENIIKRKQESKLLHTWENASITTRFIKDKAEAFARNRKYIGLKFAVQKWRSRTFATEKIKIKHEKAIVFNEKKIIKKFFGIFKDTTIQNRSLPKALKKISNKFAFNNIIRGLSILKSHSMTNSLHENCLKQKAVCTLASVAEKIFRSRIITYLGLIGSHTILIKGRANQLARVTTSIYLWRLRRGFERIRTEKNKKVLEANVEIDGQKAHQLEKLNEEIAIIEDKFRKEGYEDEEIADHTGKILKNKDGLLKRAIGRWLAYQNSNDHILSAIDQWKKFTREKLNQKRILRKFCNLIENFSLHRSFSRWKNYNKGVLGAFKGNTKDELIEITMSKGKERAAVASDLVQKQNILEQEHEIENEFCKKKEISKKLSLAFLDKINEITKRKAVVRWRGNFKRQKIGELRKNLDELEEKTKEIITNNNTLEDKNMSLSTENEELKQLSYESVGLANVKHIYLFI